MVITSAISEKPTFSSKTFRISSVTVQRPPLLRGPVAQAITLRLIHILDPSDIDLPPFPIPPPPLIKVVARKPKSLNPESHLTLHSHPVTNLPLFVC